MNNKKQIKQPVFAEVNRTKGQGTGTLIHHPFINNQSSVTCVA